MEDMEPDEVMDYLLSIGALEQAGFDADSGEQLYRLTEKCEEFLPEFTELFYEQFSAQVFMLWQKGLIDVVFDEEGEPMISPNDQSFDEDNWDDLDIEGAFVLKQIISVFAEMEDDEWYNKEEDDE